MYLSVIIPVYNEEKRILSTLLSIDNYFKKQSYDWEVLVVNDGSKDKTVDLVDSLRGKIKNLKLINNKNNHGKGYVVRQGLVSAIGKYRIFIDADGSTPIEEVEKILTYLDGYDIIIGSRSISGSEILRAQPYHRRVLGKIYSAVVGITLGLWEFKDTQCGFKLFKSECLEKILPKCKINGWSFDVEILLLAKKLGYKIKEVPIKWENSADTRVKLGGMMRSIYDLIMLGWIVEFIKFSVVGLSGTLINFIIFYCLTELLSIYYIYSAIAAFVVAMTNNFIFNKLWTFERKGTDLGKNYIKFSLVSLVALLLNLLLLYILTESFGVYYLFSQILAIIASMAINFLGNKFWTFKDF